MRRIFAAILLSALICGSVLAQEVITARRRKSVVAIGYVQSQQNAAHLVLSVSKAFDSNNTGGNIIVGACGQDNSGTGTGNTGYTDLHNSYTQINTDAAGTLVTGAWDYATGIASGANTGTCAPGIAGTVDLDLVEVEIQGVTALDQHNINACQSACGSTQSTLTINTAQTDMVMSFVYDADTSHAWSINASSVPSGGWTICAKCVTSNPNGETLAVAYQILAAGSGYKVVWNNLGTTSVNIVSAIASFKP